MSFDGPIRTQWAENGLEMIVLERVTYTDPNGRVWIVRSGFVTNGASIPGFFQGAVGIGSPFTGKHRVAAVFHDAAYATSGVTKEDADHMFRDAMRDLGCEQNMIDALYDAVHLFGHGNYNAAQREAAR
jgi:hypothetical protein